MLKPIFWENRNIFNLSSAEFSQSVVKFIIIKTPSYLPSYTAIIYSTCHGYRKTLTLIVCVLLLSCFQCLVYLFSPEGKFYIIYLFIYLFIVVPPLLYITKTRLFKYIENFTTKETKTFR